MQREVITSDAAGLYCAPGAFHIDPWGSVPVAVLTHAHGDHARPGSGLYYAARDSLPILRRRLGPDARIEGLAWGERLHLGATEISLHPSGHILGAAQIGIESDAGIWVVGGDYKRAADPTCAPFEPVSCDVFVTEATFALPIYRWTPARETVQEILDWWNDMRAAGRTALLGCYALGKAQRILAELATMTNDPVYVHGAIEPLVQIYREAGVRMLETRPVAEAPRKRDYAGELVLCPPGALTTPWARRFGDASRAVASGWMRLRGIRRRRNLERGFVLSDHADWPALLATIAETGASRVLATHGYADTLARYLVEQGTPAAVLATAFDAGIES